ncbi:hypothetical protein L9F63_016994, partial [Diploptera punctata]
KPPIRNITLNMSKDTNFHDYLKFVLQMSSFNKSPYTIAGLRKKIPLDFVLSSLCQSHCLHDFMRSANGEYIGVI